MEQQTPNVTSTDNLTPSSEFASGTSVIYGLLGKCQVLGIETRTIGAEAIRFYKLEVQKSALSRSTRQEPAIWLPVASAKDRGLRVPMTRDDADKVWAVLGNREYYFSVNDSWNVAHAKLEACIRTEGSIGLAKVISFLHVLKKRMIVPSPEVSKFYDAILKLTLRELSDATGETIRPLEERVNKSLRHKLIPDN
jgi:CarD family transcriptional regulator